jgi:hypothetical protein
MKVNQYNFVGYMEGGRECSIQNSSAITMLHLLLVVMHHALSQSKIIQKTRMRSPAALSL